MRATIRVPASVANLGPGLDIFGLGLGLENEVQAVGRSDGKIEVISEGELGPYLDNPETNLVCVGYRLACAKLGVVPGGVEFFCQNRIPIGRGLGSSSAALVAGVMSAGLLFGLDISQTEVISLVGEWEGHAENAAASVLGGFVICTPGTTAVRMVAPRELRVVLFVPNKPLPTAVSRQALPAQFSRAAATFNAARCALMVYAWTNQEWGRLRVAMEDSWHQAARTGLIPFAPALIQAALEGGALGACIAGAGPSILALGRGDLSDLVANLFQEATRQGVEGKVMVLGLNNLGARGAVA